MVLLVGAPSLARSCATLSGGQRQPNRNIDTSESGTSYPSGLWSDGRTLWVVDDLAKRIYAYTVLGLGSTP